MTTNTRTLRWLLVVPVVLWIIVFAWKPLPFWDLMVPSMAILLILAVLLRGSAFKLERPTGFDVLSGIGSAAVLYGVFKLGSIIAPLILPGAQTDIGGVYGMTSSISPVLISCFLLLIIGPAESLFWQGTVQATWMDRFGKNAGWLMTAGFYGAIHIASLNPMLVTAALTAGLGWGLQYRLQGRIWAIVVSHALWDFSILVLWPIK